jgi:2-oxoglutarate dehydrogenase E1 component
MAISSIDEFTSGGFNEVLNDIQAGDSAWAKKVERVVLCSGKVYYDLLNERQNQKRTDTALIRVEQLYPWPAASLEAIKKAYPAAKDWVWCQEEPNNMGAWWYVTQQAFAQTQKLRYAGRPWSCSPAAGSPKTHEAEQKALISEAFKG